MFDPHELALLIVLAAGILIFLLVLWLTTTSKRVAPPTPLEAPPVAQIQPPSWLTPAPTGKIWCLHDDGWKLVDIEPDPGVKAHGAASSKPKRKSPSKSGPRRKAKRAA